MDKEKKKIDRLLFERGKRNPRDLKEIQRGDTYPCKPRYSVSQVYPFTRIH